MKISIKHMVCPRCIEAVRSAAREMELEPVTVELGELEVASEPDEDRLRAFSERISALGFALAEKPAARLVAKIKAAIIERIHYQNGESSQNLSTYLSQKLNYDYSKLSKLFSASEAKTIERFATMQRIERAKELLSYGEDSITEIAGQLDYSSPAHFAAQFRHETGMSPRDFRRLQPKTRATIDRI